MDASLHEKRMAFIKDLNKKTSEEKKKPKQPNINKPENFNKIFRPKKRLLKSCA